MRRGERATPCASARRAGGAAASGAGTCRGIRGANRVAAAPAVAGALTPWIASRDVVNRRRASNRFMRAYVEALRLRRAASNTAEQYSNQRRRCRAGLRRARRRRAGTSRRCYGARARLPASRAARHATRARGLGRGLRRGDGAVSARRAAGGGNAGPKPLGAHGSRACAACVPRAGGARRGGLRQGFPDRDRPQAARGPRLRETYRF